MRRSAASAVPIGLRLTRAAVQAACRGFAGCRCSGSCGRGSGRRAGRAAARCAVGCGGGARRRRGRRALRGAAWQQVFAAVEADLPDAAWRRSARAAGRLAVARCEARDARVAGGAGRARDRRGLPGGQVTVPASRSIAKSSLAEPPVAGAGGSGTGASTSIVALLQLLADSARRRRRCRRAPASGAAARAGWSTRSLGLRGRRARGRARPRPR